MTWPAVILLALAFVGLFARVCYWIGGLLAETELFLERAAAGECTCTRHRLCTRCLAELRGDQGGSEGRRSSRSETERSALSR